MAIAETAIVKYFQHVNMRYKTFDSEMKQKLLTKRIESEPSNLLAPWLN